MIRLQRLKYELGPSSYKPPGVSFWKDEENDFQIHAGIKLKQNILYKVCYIDAMLYLKLNY